MDYKKMISDELHSDISDAPEVKTIVIQELLWPGMQEHKAFCAGGQTFSALYQGENKLTDFEEVPKQEKM